MTDVAHAFVVIAEFTLKPEGRTRFMDIAYQDAHDSVTNEPGCHHFDVLVSQDDPLQVTLHEVYADQAAFDAHVAAPHFVPFRDETPALIEAQHVRFYRQATPIG